MPNADNGRRDSIPQDDIAITARLDGEIAKLRDALAPFAAAFERVKPNVAMAVNLWPSAPVWSGEKPVICVSDLSRAHRLYNGSRKAAGTSITEAMVQAALHAEFHTDAGGDVAAKGESFTLSDILDGEGLNAREQDEAVAVILSAALGAQRHRMREIVEDRCRQQQATSDSRYKEGSHWRAQAYAAQVLRDLIAELDA